MKKKNKLKKVYKEKTAISLNKLKIFNKTGKIVANPLLNKNNDYFT